MTLLVLQMSMPVEIITVDAKLKEIRKWAMRHRVKPAPAAAPTGIRTFFSPKPAPEPASELGPISSVTEEEAAKNPILAQLKVVQEAGDPNF